MQERETEDQEVVIGLGRGGKRRERRERRQRAMPAASFDDAAYRTQSEEEEKKKTQPTTEKRGEEKRREGRGARGPRTKFSRPWIMHKNPGNFWYSGHISEDFVGTLAT